MSFLWTLQKHKNNQYSKHKLSYNNEYQSHHPTTNSDVHLCLFDHFFEKNMSSELESLRKIGCILELKGMLNRQVDEQLHLQFNSNKKFLNMKTPVTRTYLFHSILDHHNINKNKTVTNLLQQKTWFKLIFDSFWRLQFETYSNTNFHPPSPSSTLFEKREDENRLIQNEPLNIEDNLSKASSEFTDDNENAHQYDACPPNTRKMKRSSGIEQHNCFKNCSKSRIEKMSNLTEWKIWITYSLSLEPPICLTRFHL